MATFVEDVGVYFVGLASDNEILSNLGTPSFAVNTNLFYIVEPQSPVNCVTLIPQPGEGPDVRHRNAQYPSMQIRVKAETVVKGYKVTQAIINDLHQSSLVGSDIQMLAFAKQSAPIFLDYDDSEYPIYVCNFDFMSKKYSVS